MILLMYWDTINQQNKYIKGEEKKKNNTKDTHLNEFLTSVISDYDSKVQHTLNKCCVHLLDRVSKGTKFCKKLGRLD